MKQSMSKIQRFESLLLAVWLGSMVGVGYIAAPVLFRSLDDRQLAGSLAGQMFSVVGTMGLFIGLILVALSLFFLRARAVREWRFWTVVMMLLLVIAGQFIVQPYMVELKALGLDIAENARRFGMMHGVSSTLYLLTSLGGVVLILFGLRKSV